MTKRFALALLLACTLLPLAGCGLFHRECRDNTTDRDSRSIDCRR